jgi:hypothetical protein
MTGKYLLLALLATTAFAQDPVSITPYQLLDARSGQAVACSGCSIYTYAAGTNTPLATYTSSTLATPNTNPVLTNSAGYAVNGATITGIWVGSSCYKFVAKDSTAVTLFTQDNICDRGAVLKALLAASSGSSLVGFIQSQSGATARTVQAKLRDVLSPKDFGAVGDCTTDDTVAFTAAVLASSGKVLDGGGSCYATTSAAIPITVSNVVIQNFRMKVNRAAPAVTNSYESSGLYYAGDINQKNVTIQNAEFSGTGYWSGIESSVIYFLEGWNGGSPVPNVLNYQTRKNMTIQNITFTNPYYEAVFTTNVQTLMYNLRADGCQNITTTACFYSRATTDIVFDGIKIIEGYDKGVSSAYANRAKYNNIQTVNLTVLGGAIYVGYFNQDSNVTNCSVQLTNADPDAGFFKASYYSQRTTVTGCTFIGTGYVMFQGAKDFTFTGNVIKTSGYRGLRLLYGNEFVPDQQNQGGVITGNYISGCLLAGCSVVSTATSPRIVDMSNCQNCIFDGNNVMGNIVANPAYDLAVTNNMIDFSPTGYLTAIPAIYLQALNNGRVSGNRVLSGWTSGTPTIALSGTIDAATMTVANNEFTVPTDAANYGVSASTTVGDASSIFRYSNNTALNVPPGSQYELGTSNFTAANSYISYVQKYIQAISTALGGAPLLAGACATDAAVTATGAVAGDFVVATPTTYPGDGFFVPPPMVTGANTVTVKICASVAGTPTASTYRIRVLPYRP